MKILTIVLCLIFSFFIRIENCLSQDLFVWANSGVNLRERPNILSKSQGVIDKGGRVKLLNKTKETQNLQVTENVRERNGLVLKGNWLHVESCGKSGYVISTYLSRLPYPKTYNIIEYFSGVLSSKVDTIEAERSRTVYVSNKISIRNRSGEGCAFNETIEINDVTYEEGFLLFYFFQNIDNSNKGNLIHRYSSEDEYYQLIEYKEKEMIFHCWMVETKYIFGSGKAKIISYNG